MPNIIEQLRIVQEKDRKIHALVTELAEIPRDQENVKKQLSTQQQHVSQAKQTLQEHQSKIKSLDFDIETRRKTTERLKEQQFETKKNEQYRALGHEVERYQKEVDDLETELLMLMEQDDELQQSLASGEQALNEASKQIDAELAELATLQQNLQSRLDELRRERAALLPEIDDEALSLYDRLLSKKGVPVVVPIERELCGGCHLKLVATTLGNARTVDAITQCENCARILYYE